MRKTTLSLLPVLAALACDAAEPPATIAGPGPAFNTVVTPGGTVTVTETTIPSLFSGTPDPGVALNEAKAINEKGQVVGWSLTDTDPVLYRHAFLWSDGQLHDFGTLGGSESSAEDINSAGNVVGHSNTSDGFLHPFLWDGALHDLGTLPGYQNCLAQSISDSGEVVGTCTSPVSAGLPAVRAFVWKKNRNGGALEVLGDPAATGFSLASAVSSRGDVAGASSALAGLPLLPTIWSGDIPRTLVVPAGFVSGQVEDLNAKGESVGYVAEPGGLPDQSMLWTRTGTPIALAPLGEAHAVNDNGEVVGETFDFSTGKTAFFWSPATGVVRMENGVWAYDINNARVAVGLAEIGSTFHAAIWTVSITP